MKQFSFIRVGFLFALVVTIASCGMPLYSTDGYYEETPERSQVYRGSTYGSGPVVYERDPYTGRYYEVSPYGYSRPASPYYDRRSNRYYNNNRNYNNNSRYYNNGSQNRNYPQAQQQPQQQPQTREQATRDREEAREKILGGKRVY